MKGLVWVFACLMFLSGCYVALIEEVTETIPVPQDSEVLKLAYSLKYSSTFNDKDMLFLGTSGLENYQIVAQILGIDGVLEESAEVLKTTFTTIARKEIEKNEFVPHSVRQYKSFLKFGTGKRELGQVGDVMVPLETDK